MLSVKTFTTGWWFGWTALSGTVAAIVVFRRRLAAADRLPAATPTVRIGTLAGVLFAAFIGCGELDAENEPVMRPISRWTG